MTTLGSCPALWRRCARRTASQPSQMAIARAPRQGLLSLRHSASRKRRRGALSVLFAILNRFAACPAKGVLGLWLTLACSRTPGLHFYMPLQWSTSAETHIEKKPALEEPSRTTETGTSNFGHPPPKKAGASLNPRLAHCQHLGPSPKRWSTSVEGSASGSWGQRAEVRPPIFRAGFLTGSESTSSPKVSRKTRLATRLALIQEKPDPRPSYILLGNYFLFFYITPKRR